MSAIASSDPVLAVRDLIKDYDGGAGPTRILKGLNITIHSSEFVAVMGPSGSGKSTFMNILGGLDTPTQGDYLLNGRSVASLNADELASLRRDEIGFVFQGFNLLARSSLIDNVALPLIYAGVSAKERRERAIDLLHRVGLGHRLDAMPSQISGGQQQRVAIARALVNRPALILADEPTGNLDTQTSIDIMQLFTQLNQEEGITLVVVTHEPDIAHYAQRLIRLVDGLVAFDGPAHEGLHHVAS